MVTYERCTHAPRWRAPARGASRCLSPASPQSWSKSPFLVSLICAGGRRIPTTSSSNQGARKRRSAPTLTGKPRSYRERRREGGREGGRERSNKRALVPRHNVQRPCPKRECLIGIILARVHFTIETIWWTGLAPWEFESPFPGTFASTFPALPTHPTASGPGPGRAHLGGKGLQG